jgi:hypothetical protein
MSGTQPEAAGQTGVNPLFDPAADPSAELGELLVGVVDGVLQAQQQMDAFALRQQVVAANTPTGELVLPPLWYTFTDVEIAIDLSVTLTRSDAGQARLLCSTVEPGHVSMYGWQAAAGLHVRARLAPQGLATLQSDAVPPPPPPTPAAGPSAGAIDKPLNATPDA